MTHPHRLLCSLAVLLSTMPDLAAQALSRPASPAAAASPSPGDWDTALARVWERASLIQGDDEKQWELQSSVAHRLGEAGNFPQAEACLRDVGPNRRWRELASLARMAAARDDLTTARRLFEHALAGLRLTGFIHHELLLSELAIASAAIGMEGESVGLLGRMRDEEVYFQGLGRWLAAAQGKLSQDLVNARFDELVSLEKSKGAIVRMYKAQALLELVKDRRDSVLVPIPERRIELAKQSLELARHSMVSGLGHKTEVAAVLLDLGAGEEAEIVLTAGGVPRGPEEAPAAWRRAAWLWQRLGNQELSQACETKSLRALEGIEDPAVRIDALLNLGGQILAEGGGEVALQFLRDCVKLASLNENPNIRHWVCARVLLLLEKVETPVPGGFIEDLPALADGDGKEGV